MQTEP